MVVPQELTPEVWAALPPAVAALLGWQAEQIRILDAKRKWPNWKLNSAKTRPIRRCRPRPQAPARQAAAPQAQRPPPAWRPTRPPPTPACLAADRPVPTGRPVCADCACRQALRPGADRQRPAAAPPPGLGTARLPAERNRIPATPARLCLRLFELQVPLPAVRSQRPGRALTHRLRRSTTWPASVSPKRRADALHFLSLILNQPASRRLAGRVAEPPPPTPCGRPTTNWPDNCRNDFRAAPG